MKRRRSKFGAVKTVVDGITFHSKKEAKRYADLMLLQKAGKIKKLELQPEYEIIVNGKKICKYIADFVYHERDEEHEKNGGSPYWTIVTEDVKGVRTGIYRLKKKLVEAVYGIRIKET